jgi:hypothetical protein
MSVTEIESATIVDDFVKTMKWSDDTPEEVRSLVIMNLRGFWQWMHSDSMEGCQSALDQAFDARFRQGVTIRGIPVWVCAEDFTGDRSVGQSWGPEQIWAIRRDDGTMFELTPEEHEHWFGVAAESVPEFPDDPEW